MNKINETYAVQFLSRPSLYVKSAVLPISANGYVINYADGHSALCGTSGVWNTALGYGNKAIAEAIHQAALDASYLSLFRTSNYYAEQAAEQLLQLSKWDYKKILFSTSGSAAVDTALKICRFRDALQNRFSRKLVVSIRGSYHGMTLAAMSVGGQDLGQKIHQISQSNIRLIDRWNPNDIVKLLQISGDQINAVIIEPVLGSGTLPVNTKVIQEIIKGRSLYGYSIIADEVATGFGRTGPMYASEEWNEQPDLLITSKALTNGTIAASAIFISKDLYSIFECNDVPIYHAETQAGSPISCAAISATIKQFASLDVLSQGLNVSQHVTNWLEYFSESFRGCFREGVGCFQSLHLVNGDGDELASESISSIVEHCRASGATVYPGPSAIQFIPALTYPQEMLDTYFSHIEDVLRKDIGLKSES